MLKSTLAKVAPAGRTVSGASGLVSTTGTVFLTSLAVALFYATVLLVVVYSYRKAYGIVGKPELALQSIAKSLARVGS